MDEIKYLGIIVTSNLSWGSHIQHIRNKANRSLGLIRSVLFNADAKVKEAAVNTIVRPNLEYASCVWDPSTTHLTHLLEQVQRRGARFVCGIPYNSRNDVSLTHLLKNMKWPTLALRRKRRRLILFHQMMQNNSSCLYPIYSKLNPSDKRYSLRKETELRVNPPTMRTNTKRDSFVVKTIKDWNSLTLETKRKGPEDFKKHLLLDNY